jgi:hypothetical protein
MADAHPATETACAGILRDRRIELKPGGGERNGKQN